VLAAQPMAERIALDTELAKLRSGQIALMLAPLERLPHLPFRAVLHLCANRNMKAVYVSVTRPAATLQAEFERAGVPKDRFCIIDCVSQVNGVEPQRPAEALLAKSPAALTQISSLVDQALKKLGAGDIVVHIDSVALMLNWASFESVVKFLVLTTARLREQHVTALLVVPGRHEERLMTHIAPICDRVLQLRPGRAAPHAVPMAIQATAGLLGQSRGVIRRIGLTMRPGHTVLRFREATSRVLGLLAAYAARIRGTGTARPEHGPWWDAKGLRWISRPVATLMGSLSTDRQRTLGTRSPAIPTASYPAKRTQPPDLIHRGRTGSSRRQHSPARAGKRRP